MSTIQQIKNFIRHGEYETGIVTILSHPLQPANIPTCATGKHARATPDDDAVRKIDSASSARQEKIASHSDPNISRSVGTDTAAKAPNKNRESRKVDEASLAKLVAEENANKSKFPHYPGLERWQLIEKMGDGAFSNVYKARDTQGQYGEVAIKVVRKYEMNNLQVSQLARFVLQSFFLLYALPFRHCTCINLTGSLPF